ncbi:MAG: hypothetical protein IJR19_03715, partial [Lachnospiraceae bacterium]|nr:hypothetical protein [Lachnospiraceae bacterium]
LKEMGINEPVELLYIDGTPIKSFVESRYNYKGNDPRILGYYAALTAGDLKYPMTCLRPRLKNGSLDLVAENIAIDFDTMDPKNSELMDARQAVREEQKNKLRMEYLKAGIEAQGELVKDPPSLFIEKAGRAHRKLMNLECSGLTAVEGLADRVRALRGKDIGPDQRFHTFLREFTGYYTYVEKFAVSPQSVPITQAGASRLVAMLELALSPLRSYIKGKDMKLARHAIAHDAYEILRKQKKILSNALENGVLSKEGSSVPITDLLGQAR